MDSFVSPARMRPGEMMVMLGTLFLLLALPSGLMAQQAAYLRSDTGTPLPFATLSVPAKSIFLTTDLDGRVILPPQIERQDTLIAQYTAMATTMITLEELANRNYLLELSPLSITLETPVIVGRRDELSPNLIYATEVVTGEEIERLQSRTSADALANLSGVFVQQSQFGGGSPVIRGFEANRVLLVVDGVRMNNAIYRNGHLQNAITVDPNALEQLELIYGAGALAYGSDAIGGVVHFRTRRPRYQTSKNQVSGGITLGYATAASTQSGVGWLEYGGKRWAGLTQLSYADASHLRSGAQRPRRFPSFGERNEFVERINGQDQVVPNDRPEVQVGTGYRQANLLQKFRFRLREQLELDLNLQYSTSSNIPRYDALTARRDGQLRWAEWDYGPQTRLMGSARLTDRRATKYYDVANYLISTQFIEEDRLQRRFGDPLRENSLVDVYSHNLQIDFVKDLGKLELRYGIDARHDEVDSQGFLTDITGSGERISGLNSRYPSGGSSLTTLGSYSDLSYHFAPSWLLRGGLRSSWQRLRATFGTDDPIDWPAAYLAGITNADQAMTGALGLRYNGVRNQWRLQFSQGFRAPNIDDFAKFRERNGFILVPNPNLSPERSNTLETGYSWADATGRLFLTGGLYHTWLNQAIVRRDGTLPSGEDFFVSRGDTLRTQTNVNAESARVYGFDLGFRWDVRKKLRLASNFHWLRGRRKQLPPDGAVLELPQDHIPPAYGTTSLTYRAAKWTLETRFRYQLAKAPEDYAVGSISGTARTGYTLDRTGTSDNLELSPVDPITGAFAGTYGWWTANVYAEYRPSSRWALRLKAENLLDRHYRTFSSGVSAAGLDVGLSASYTL
ncbi:TonB-dependent receptor [Lewinella sp. W8]|uniref:TonB-dependent receptor n=1 Tax=Lewinella sp. W8 TaxID=2528208 RepID=UPI0010679BB9|nr:TonB-dependent receptor [Lewinella sp. W8]MTB51777.1 TonB-dependent receptor [Lewinella sp. W8]